MFIGEYYYQACMSVASILKLDHHHGISHFSLTPYVIREYGIDDFHLLVFRGRGRACIARAHARAGSARLDTRVTS